MMLENENGACELASEGIAMHYAWGVLYSRFKLYHMRDDSTSIEACAMSLDISFRPGLVALTINPRDTQNHFDSPRNIRI